MRQKAIFYDRDNTNKHNNKNDNTNVDETIHNKLQLKTRKCPPRILNVKDIENNILKLIKNIQFKTVCDKFLKKLNEDINKNWIF